MTSKLISVTEAAKLRQMSAAMVRRWCQTGWLKSASKIGGVWIVNREEILSFVPPKVGRKPMVERATQASKPGSANATG